MGNPDDPQQRIRADAYWQMPISDYVAPPMSATGEHPTGGSDATGLLDDESRLETAWIATITAFKARTAEDREKASKDADAIREHVEQLRKGRAELADMRTAAPNAIRSRTRTIRWWHLLFHRHAIGAESTTVSQ